MPTFAGQATVIPQTEGKALILGQFRGINGFSDLPGIARLLLEGAPRTAIAITGAWNPQENHGSVEMIFQAVCCPAPVVEVSSDLIHWTQAKGTAPELGNNRLRFVDEQGVGAPGLFYRLRSPAQAAKAARQRHGC